MAAGTPRAPNPVQGGAAGRGAVDPDRLPHRPRHFLHRGVSGRDDHLDRRPRPCAGDGGADLPGGRHVRAADHDLAAGTDPQRPAGGAAVVSAARVSRSLMQLEGEEHAGGPHRSKMDRRVLRDFRALRGQAGRHRRDPVGDAVARAQCASGRTRAAADGRAAVPRRRADAAQPADRADPLDRRQRGDPAAGAGRHRAAAGRLRGRLHHRRPDARGGDAGNPEGRRAHSGDLQRAPRSAGAHGAGYRRWRSACARRRRCCAEPSACA